MFALILFSSFFFETTREQSSHSLLPGKENIIEIFFFRLVLLTLFRLKIYKEQCIKNTLDSFIFNILQKELKCKYCIKGLKDKWTMILIPHELPNFTELEPTIYSEWTIINCFLSSSNKSMIKEMWFITTNLPSQG